MLTINQEKAEVFLRKRKDLQIVDFPPHGENGSVIIELLDCITATQPRDLEIIHQIINSFEESMEETS